MKIAVTYENGLVYGHFGHTKEFKIYEVLNNEVTNETIFDVSDSGHCALAKVLVENGVEVLICGGLGKGAVNALNSAGIKLFAGVSGSADDAVSSLLAGNLSMSSEANCDHHHDENHNCGSHDHSCDCH